ncbi:hypothetical protein A2U01_0040649, partial [Trifolium medium]|nr:hypothetical protein [Trifolium medium]
EVAAKMLNTPLFTDVVANRYVWKVNFVFRDDRTLFGSFEFLPKSRISRGEIVVIVYRPECAFESMELTVLVAVQHIVTGAVNSMHAAAAGCVYGTTVGRSCSMTAKVAYSVLEACCGVILIHVYGRIVTASEAASDVFDH